MNDGILIVFDDLVRCVIDGVATEEELQDLVAMMHDDPDLQTRYCQQMYIHALLTCHKGQEWPEDGKLVAAVCPTRVKGGLRNWWRAAAAGVVLLGGAAVWYGAENTGMNFGLRGRKAADSVVPAIRLVSQKSVNGLNLPATLPGALRLESGEVVVRLQTGVELTVLGPASMEIQNGLRVHLECGKMLANVPHWATGFTVRTKELEIIDLGTLFSVQANERSSDVFVLKGSVQVNETKCEWGRASSGEDIGVCGAGEGVRAVRGESPVKVNANWPETKKLFESVKDSLALVEMGGALKIVTRIAELWADKNVLGADRVAPKVASARAIPFRKTAWVRPTEVNHPHESHVRTLMDLLSAAGATSVSEPVHVESSPDGDNRRWSTVFTNAVSLKWDWVAAATRARLEIAGMNGFFATNVTAETSDYLWRPFASRIPSVEDIYNLSLTFYGDDETVVGLSTARLVVMTGAFGKTVVDPRPAQEGWVFTQRNMIIPYDAYWAAATADASGSLLTIATPRKMTQTNRFAETSGYYGCKLDDFGAGTFELGLTFPGTTKEWTSKVFWSLGGTIISVR